ncbi:MAG: plastocyanin/azurin family copper-binding protein [Mucilaginibacter sp.]
MKTSQTKSISGIFLLLALLSGCASPTHTPKSYTVKIKDMKFVPETITVAKGDTVIWINEDMVSHDVTEEAAKTWSSGPVSTNGSWKMVISAQANYYCSIHTIMKGRIELDN